MDISLLILLAVILVAVAVLIGYLLGSVLGGKSAQPPPQAHREGLERCISFYTDRQARRFILQIEGRTVESPHLLTENERRSLILLEQALRQWVSPLPAASIQPTEDDRPEKAEKRDAGGAMEPQPRASTPLAPLSSPLPEARTSSSPTETGAKKGVADWLAQALQPKTSAGEPPRSIAMQVDEILQRKLQERGWGGRGIRLMELPHKGMVVLIGLDQYATVEEVPDPEIQTLIRASVREWETKMTGG